MYHGCNILTITTINTKTLDHSYTYEEAHTVVLEIVAGIKHC